MSKMLCRDLNLAQILMSGGRMIRIKMKRKANLIRKRVKEKLKITKRRRGQKKSKEIGRNL